MRESSDHALSAVYRGPGSNALDALGQNCAIDKSCRTRLIVIVLALAASTAAPASSEPKLVLLRGPITSATATSIVISTASGPKTASFDPHTHFLGIGPSALAKVTKGSFVGTAVVPQADGTFRSTEVHIFAPSLRGTDEGFTKMDPEGKRMMANSTVRAIDTPLRLMANSTVRSARSSADDTTITLVFKSGRKVIKIPRATPVVSLEPGSKALLVLGAHVLVFALPESRGLTAKSLLIGERGVIPPL